MDGGAVKDQQNLEGRRILITGANNRLGFETAKALASLGAEIILAVRDPAKGEAAASQIGRKTRIAMLDLADLSSIGALAERWSDPIDCLINNAGVSMLPQRQTRDGFEMQFGTNHLGHYALTNRLLPFISDRVVTIASGAHRMGLDGIQFDDVNLVSNYSPLRAYAQSKLANLLFTLELQRRLTLAGSHVRSFAAHPGMADTDLLRNISNPLQRWIMRLSSPFMAQSSARAALNPVYAATHDLPGGSYVGPDGPGERKGLPCLAARSRAASDPVAAQKLWTLSEEMTGVSFPL